MARTTVLPLALSDQGRLAYQTGDLKRARTALERFIEKDKENKSTRAAAMEATSAPPLLRRWGTP